MSLGSFLQNTLTAGGHLLSAGVKWCAGGGAKAFTGPAKDVSGIAKDLTGSRKDFVETKIAKINLSKLESSICIASTDEVKEFDHHYHALRDKIRSNLRGKSNLILVLILSGSIAVMCAAPARASPVVACQVIVILLILSMFAQSKPKATTVS